jgi:hypothetical protein
VQLEMDTSSTLQLISNASAAQLLMLQPTHRLQLLEVICTSYLQIKESLFTTTLSKQVNVLMIVQLQLAVEKKTGSILHSARKHVTTMPIVMHIRLVTFHAEYSR